jgi:hypothetical protein
MSLLIWAVWTGHFGEETDNKAHPIQSQDATTCETVITFVLIILIFVLIGLYFCAKLVFVWAALVDVFHLPDEAYQVAAWSRYLPHVF